jgi:hypothetical protein
MNDEEPQRKTLGRPFTKGDGRINRRGRPRSFDQFRALAQKIAGEKLVTPGGSTLTVAEAILRSWAKSKEPQLQRAFIEFAFGKVPDKLETDMLQPKTILRLHYAHEFDQKFGDTAVQAKILPDDAPNGEDTRFPLLPDTDFSVP